MLVYHITIINNVEGAEGREFFVGKHTYNKINEMQYAGGFLRYHINLISVESKECVPCNTMAMNYVKLLIGQAEVTNLWLLYQEAINNNDGQHVDTLRINGAEYDLYTEVRSNALYVIIQYDSNPLNDKTIAIYSPSGTAIWVNTDKIMLTIL